MKEEKKRKKIFMLDDEKRRFGWLEILLKEQSDWCDLEIFKSVDEAKARLEREKPDLFILDIMLPKGAMFGDKDIASEEVGIEFFKWMRKEYTELKILVYTILNKEDLKGLPLTSDEHIKYLRKTEASALGIVETIKKMIGESV